MILASLSFLLGTGQPHAQDTPKARVKLELQTHILHDERLEGVLFLRPASAPGDPISIPIQGVRQVALSLPANSVWEVEPQIQRYWAGRTRIEVKGPEQVADYILGLWPKGTMAGSVAVEPGQRLPDRLSVKLRSARIPGRKVDVPELTVDCPVDKKGAWLCDVPATLVDLSVRVEGFVPHYRWAAQLERDKTLNLGRLALKRGASVAGWAQVAEGNLDPLQAKARLSPLVAPGGNSSLAERLLGSSNLEAPLDTRGYFQFAGVAPGSYVLEVTQPGFAPARVSPIEVWPGSETSLTQPLELRRPLAIELAVSPETDWLGKPWRVQLTKAPELGGLAGLVYDGATDSKGSVTLQGQTPGTFTIVVFDSLNNPMYSDFDVPIREAVDGQLTIDIDLVTVQGEVFLGDEPLSATLYFGSRHAALGSKMDSDDEGVFHGVLPRDGNWFVDIDSEQPALSVPTTVDVRARGDGTARVSIRIPDTRVFGKVVDENGRPVAARVIALSGKGDAEAKTDPEGSFDLQGVPEGPVRLSARAGKLISEGILVVLEEEQPAGPFELRLRKDKPFLGRVQSPRGPVPGASLAIFPLKPILPGADSARTDLQGDFEASVPEPAQTVLAVVSPPGNSLKGFEVPLDGRPAVLEVAPEGGTLEITGVESDNEGLAQDLQMVVFQNGLRIPWDLMLSWAQGHGGRLRTPFGFRIPNVAPGEYRVCSVPLSELIQRGTEGPSGLRGACASGFLEGGGTLRLDLRP